MQSIEINKSIIRDFYQRAVGQGDIAFARQIIADDYIQHSPGLKPGKAGVLEALEYMKQMPKPATTTTPFMRLIAEGDYVVTNLSFDWGDTRKVVVDLFRFENGKVAEHWDAVEDEPDTTLNGHPMMDGPMPGEDADLTMVNKQLVCDFYQRVVIDQQLEVMPDFIAPDLVQHMPDIADGIDGLRTYLTKSSETWSIRLIDRVIGEGDFVVVQTQGQFRHKQATFYAICRINDGEIVEQWGVKRLVP
ncbi:nuclear transport factor 2 family protein [Spirosoma soli]|uniref:Nuclear transport factor 2 family protein n=1 Tax=Spirosoma soli TaxID=1770529 RepID=A0ABW5MD24_9BACT